jgi:hypothetical protein
MEQTRLPFPTAPRGGPEVLEAELPKCAKCDSAVGQLALVPPGGTYKIGRARPPDDELASEWLMWVNSYWFNTTWSHIPDGKHEALAEAIEERDWRVAYVLMPWLMGLYCPACSTWFCVGCWVLKPSEEEFIYYSDVCPKGHRPKEDPCWTEVRDVVWALRPWIHQEGAGSSSSSSGLALAETLYALFTWDAGD